MNNSISDKSISFIDPEVQACPFKAYEEIRNEGPAYYDKSCGYYIIPGYDDVKNALQDAKTFSSITGQLLVKDAPYQAKVDAIFKEHGYPPVNVLVVQDPPVHTFHRALVDKVFTISRIKKMEVYLQSVVDEMISENIDRGEVEFFMEIAMKIPTYVIADQLGFPRAEFKTFRRWSESVIAEGNPDNGEQRQLEITRTLCELHQYIAKMAAKYQKDPADCLLSDLVHADVDGKKLTTAELIAMVIQILTAGNDTTTSLITSCMYRIATTAGLEDTLRDNVEKIPQFVEEVLRLESPIQGLYRRVTRDIKIGGVDIPKDAIVILKYGAANRDSCKFASPDELDLDRDNSRQHLAFGNGPHFCIGNQLGRAETRLAIISLLNKMKNIRLKDGENSFKRVSHFFGYGLCKLEIKFDKI